MANESKARDTLSRVFSNPVLLSLVLIAPSLLQSGRAISFYPRFSVAPLDGTIFEQTFQLLADKRVIFSSYLIQPLTVIYTLLPIFLLLGIFLGLRLILPYTGARRNLIAFSLSLLVAPLARPGLPFAFVATIAFSVGLITPLIARLPGLVLWLGGNTLMLFALINPVFEFPIAWLVASMLCGYALNFLFVERGALSRPIRHQLLTSTTTVMASGSLALWILLVLLSDGLPISSFALSKLWWLAPLTGITCALGTFLFPWETQRWLGLSTFAQGLLFSPSLEWPVALIFLWSLIRVLQGNPIRWPIPSAALGLLTVLGAFGFATHWGLSLPRPERTFDPQWIRVAQTLEKKGPEGLLVIGRGMPFLAHFLERPLIHSENILTMTSEEEFIKYLERNTISDVIVEREAFNHYWQDWIRNGRPPNISNASVVSRLVTFDGEEVQTKSLKLSPLKRLEIKEASHLSHFVWIKRKEGERGSEKASPSPKNSTGAKTESVAPTSE